MDRKRLDEIIDQYSSHPRRGEPSPSNGTQRAEIRLLRASRVHPENVRWAERDWIPLGAVTLSAGRKGEGKSTTAYDRLARATRGQLPGDLPGPVDVLIATAEDHRAQIAVPRLIAAGADLERVHFVIVQAEGYERGLDLPDDLDELARRAQRVRARMLFLDPLVAHMPVAVDSHKDQHVRRVLAPLARLAEELELAALASIHFNKAPGVDALMRISGSGGFVNAARCVLCCATDPDDESRRLYWREVTNLAPGRVGREYRIESRTVSRHDAAEAHLDADALEQFPEAITTSGIAWGADVDVNSRHVLAGPGDAEDHSDLDLAKTFLLDVLAPGRMKATDVLRQARQDGHSERTLRRARRAVGVVSEREGFGAAGVWYWRLPIDGQNASAEADSATLGNYGESLTRQGKDAGTTPIDDPCPETGHLWAGGHLCDLVEPEESDTDSAAGPDDPRRFTR